MVHMVANPIPHDARIYIAGHRGLVGSALWRHFQGLGYGNLIGLDSTELDLRDTSATRAFFASVRPQIVIDAAARVGGIAANASRPVEFLSDNLRIQLNLVDSAVATGVERFLFLASSCIYPKLAAQPIREEAFLTGPLEETNESYAVAKIAGVRHIAAVRTQHGLPYISAMPTNIYGPNDNFHPRDSHVLPAMIRRFDEAAARGLDVVECWGTGRPRREFLHADDLASACHFLLEHYDGDVAINVGTGVDIELADLARMVAEMCGFDGRIGWDSSMPDGTPLKRLDVSRLTALGWTAQIPLDRGISQTYSWFREHAGAHRS